jgi:acyl-coenzyme A synthetase/AMP-(fatty) acid ligase
VGVPHPILGEDLHAFVALRAGAGASADELRAWLGDRLADYKVPRSWSFVAALPRNAMGKVVKRLLAGS